MNTANAVTNESGQQMYGAEGLGRALSSNEIYSERAQSTIVWEFVESEHLSILRYSVDNVVGIAATRLAEAFKDNLLDMCNVYRSISSRHVALHCPQIKKVVIIQKNGGYVIRKDDLFTGKTYR
tara:strand:- start:94 stop:465 length:372 start_codon:yes stop_codon:yes gene_type:complete